MKSIITKLNIAFSSEICEGRIFSMIFIYLLINQNSRTVLKSGAIKKMVTFMILNQKKVLMKMAKMVKMIRNISTVPKIYKQHEKHLTN